MNGRNSDGVWRSDWVRGRKVCEQLSKCSRISTPTSINPLTQTWLEIVPKSCLKKHPTVSCLQMLVARQRLHLAATPQAISSTAQHESQKCYKTNIIVVTGMGMPYLLLHLLLLTLWAYTHINLTAYHHILMTCKSFHDWRVRWDWVAWYE